MHEELNSILHDVAEETFESLAFMFEMPTDEAPEADPMATAVVHFEGPFNGSVVLGVDESVLAVVAGNMLGVDEDQTLTPEQRTDGFKELLNVICGNLLPSIAGAEAVFNMHPPELLTTVELPDRLQGRTPAGETTLELDTGVAQLALYVDGEIPAFTGHHA